MTPKEKAEEITLIYYKLGEHLFIPMSFAKQCSLIAVEEIIDSHYYALSGIKPMIYDYWQEVKLEIQKL